MGEGGRRRKRIEEELRVLVTNLIPTTLRQAEWMCSIVERVTHEYPELRRKIWEWCAPESRRDALGEAVDRILGRRSRRPEDQP